MPMSRMTRQRLAACVYAASPLGVLVLLPAGANLAWDGWRLHDLGRAALGLVFLVLAGAAVVAFLRLHRLAGQLEEQERGPPASGGNRPPGS